MPVPNVIIIGGPTASGKSSLANQLAQRINGTIVNADSMQMYQGLPLLTAAPAAAERQYLPHELYEVLPSADSCSASRWRNMAMDVINRAHSQRRIPVLVGGTGFYINALIDGLSPIPDIPDDIREQATAELDAMGNDAFHARLEERDPEMASRLHPANSQRLIRAWEVLVSTGESLAYWQSLPTEKPPDHFSFFIATLLPPRELLYEKCNTRFERMIAQGALEEVRHLKNNIDAGTIPPHVSLTQALGYAELSDYLEGKRTLEDAVLGAQQATRNYAKRQMTWFRHQIKADITLEAPSVDVILENISHRQEA